MDWRRGVWGEQGGEKATNSKACLGPVDGALAGLRVVMTTVVSDCIAFAAGSCNHLSVMRTGCVLGGNGRS